MCSIAFACLLAPCARAQVLGDALYPVAPCRLFDSRNGPGPLPSGKLVLQAAGNCGIPASAHSILLNLTVTQPTGSGFVIAYAADLSSPPGVSNINFSPGQTRANRAVVSLSSDGTGRIALWPYVTSNGTTHVILDVTAYMAPTATATMPNQVSSLRFQAVAPCRVADTRVDANPLNSGQPRIFAVADRCGIPAGAPAVAARVTAIADTAGGFFGLYSPDQTWSGTSDLNFTPSDGPMGNLAIPLLGSTTGQDLAVVMGTAQPATSHLTIDTTGYFAVDGALGFFSLTPCRAYDSRSAPEGPLTRGVPRSIDVRAVCGIGARTAAVFANVTAVNPDAAGHILAYPTGSPVPPTAILNFNAGEPAIASANILTLADETSSQELTLLASSADTHVVVDVFAYYWDGHLVPKGTTTTVNTSSSALLQRGHVPDKMYDLGDIDTVNALNGNLSVALPVGQRYPVGGGLSYGFHLSYNSKIYDLKEHTSPLPTGGGIGYYAEAIPNRVSNAGVGWTLSIGGRLLSSTDEANNTRSGAPDAEPATWVFIGEDGAEHLFYPVLEAYDGTGQRATAPAGYFFTRDNSYLRLHLTDGSNADLELPTGEVRHFQRLNVPYFDGHALPEWRVTRISNRFPSNLVSVAYRATTTPPTYPYWTVTDSQGRTQTVAFQRDPAGIYPALVSTVSLTAFSSGAAGAQTATTTFHYAQRTINRGAQDSWSHSNLLNVSVLSSIDLPDHSSIAFDYRSDTSNADIPAGLLTLATLPTRGSIAWDYGIYSMPKPACSSRAWLSASYGVTSRVLYATPQPGGTSAELGRWSYTPVLSQSPGLVNCDGIGKPAPPEELASIIVDARHNTSVQFFSVLPRNDTYTNAPTNFDWREGALPITHPTNSSQIRVPTAAPWPSGWGMSSQAFECIKADTSQCSCFGPPQGPFAFDGSSCALKETRYLKYERDSQLNVDNGWVDDRTDLIRRVVAERTVYEADGASYVQTAHSSFDGLGHYRSSTKSGAGFSGVTRAEFTGYNAAGGYPVYSVDPQSDTYTGSSTFHVPAPTAPWLLSLYDLHTVNDTGGAGLLSRADRSCFDGSTGFLNGRRTFADGASASSTDVVVLYDHDGDGNVKEAKYYGADAGLSVTECSGIASGGQRYDVVSSWRFGTKATETYSGSGFYQLDQDIDGPSGLPSRTRDSGGLPTDLDYDTMGRPTWVKPNGVLPERDAWTEVQYIIANQGGTCAIASTGCGNPASCAAIRVIQHPPGGSTGSLAEDASYFDPLGRSARECSSLPGGAWSQISRSLDGMDAVVAESTPWSAVTYTTQYLNLDYRGRPRLVLPPDAAGAANPHAITIDYASGVRQVARTTRAATQPGVEQPGTTVELYDELGRLREYDLPGLGAQTPTITTYGYDAGDGLASVSMNWRGSDVTQQRSFTRDGLGFLRTDAEPEWTRTYSSYDPLGHAGSENDGAHALSFGFDLAARPTSVTGSGGLADCPLKTFSYYTSGVGNGRLQQSTRCNYRGTARAQVVETLTYGGREGRTDTRATTLNFSNSPSVAIGPAHDSFAQSFHYDALGHVDSLGYPQCASSFTECPSSQQVPRTVSFGWDQRKLVGIGGYAALSYHPNGLVRQVQFTTGDVWQQDVDASDPTLLGQSAHMRRPYAICKRTVADSQSCPAGGLNPFLYDGQGNVKNVGSETYTYDLQGRLTKGTLGDGNWQAFNYDGFGNVTDGTDASGNFVSAITSNKSGAGRSIPVNHQSNRLTGAVTYDTAGNQTSWNGAAYEYDELDQLSHMTSGTQDWWYMYDANDERVWLNSPGTASHPRLDRWTLRDLDGRVLRRYQASAYQWTWAEDYVWAGSRLVASESPTPQGTGRYFDDHLGSPRIDVSGAGSFGHTYLPFGEEDTTSGDSEAMKFTGQERDLNDLAGTSDDLDYMHARFYNPQLARFLSADPAMGTLDRPLTWNRYVYASDNPMTRIDPDGRADKGFSAGFAGAFESDMTLGLVKDNSASNDSETQIGQLFGHGAATILGVGETASAGPVCGAGLVTVPVTGPVSGAVAVGAGLVTAHGVLAGSKGAAGVIQTVVEMSRNRPSSRQLRKAWEKAHPGHSYPKDANGRYWDGDHHKAIADGGHPLDGKNIWPKPHPEHVDRHSLAGDFKRWGAWAKQVVSTLLQ